MYTAFFHLKQAPFSIAPDPQYLFMSGRHREALAHLLYGVGSGGGFVLLTGEIGAGKTTVCRCFLEQIPERCKVAYIFNPKMSVEELLHSICNEFGIEAAGAQTIKDYVDALNLFLLETHARRQNNVLIIDEAQNLAPEVLEQLRLLTNLETSERKLLQIILIGQPELRTMLSRPELEQLAQRVIARYHLGPLSVRETGRYIIHRLRVAGMMGQIPFAARLMPLIQKLTGGVPRRINLLCDRAMLGAYALGRARVDRAVVLQAAREVFDVDGAKTRAKRIGLVALLALISLIALVGAGLVWRGHRAAPAAAASAAAAPAKHTQPTQWAQLKPGLPTNLATPIALGGNLPPLADLAQLWGKTLSGVDPCPQAAKKNLRCFNSNGGWEELRDLNRPALLALHDEKRGAYWGLLLALNETQARLRIDGHDQILALTDLKLHFDGEFTTLWAAPRRFRDELMDGDRGVDVDWVGAQMARIDHLAKPRENAMFDQEMSRRVRQFQIAQKIKADGLVGPKTYMRLNRMAGIVEPELAQNVTAGPGTAAKK